MTIRVLVADDQSMVRAGFRMLLSREQEIDVVAEASNGLEAVAAAARFKPTVILMDIRMPELDGLQATRRILAADDTARILILTTFDFDQYCTKRSAPAPAVSCSRTTPRTAPRRHPHRGRRRRPALPRRHETRDQAVRAHPAILAATGSRRADRA
jgi:chemotaxis response regulator CheB